MKTIAVQPNNKALNAEGIIALFFNLYPNEQAKALLWSWFKLTVNGSFCKLTSEDQENFAKFFDCLQDLIAALQADTQKGEATR